MAKYRLLTFDELEELEKEFIEYLILNGIAADDWAKIKIDEPENSHKIIHLFSDVVFENIMRKTQFLELRDKYEVKVLQCLKDKFVLVGLNATKIKNAHLTDSAYLQTSMANPPSGLEVYTSEIIYKKSREQEIFLMTQNGYSISSGDLFKALCLALPH